MARHGFDDTPLAIVGMACRLPGADSLDEYWELVREGRCALTDLPPDRLNQDLYYAAEKAPGKSYTKIGGVVPERPFERGLFPEELLASSDPAHRIMLQVVVQALRHAGWAPQTLSARNAGVFIGHARGSLLSGDLIYATHIEEMARYLNQDVSAFARLHAGVREAVVRTLVDDVHARMPHRRPGGAPHVTAGDVAALIAEALGLTGPYMVVDAACASSLYALAVAAGALHDGRVDMAIVGGASYSSWQSLVLFSDARALSAHASRPFDERADGFISADGYAAVLVKTLPRALADGDTIHGVIRGIGLSNDGHGRSLWAPRKEGQVQAIRRAYGPHLSPARLQYVEAHGTSTQLGDATELDALSAALAEELPAEARIPIGSAKGNVGHTRETAGLAGLIRTLLSMRHGIVPPAAAFEIPNRQIRWNEVPFFVPGRELAWPVHESDGLRHAAVDAFGIGGMNVHVVVDAPPAGWQTAMVLPSPATAGEDVPGDAGRGDADAIAVVGMGAVLPGAHTIAAFWDLLRGGRPAIGRVPPDRWAAEIFHEPGPARPWRSPSVIGGFITDYVYDWRRHKIPPKQVETGDLLQFMLLDAADQALDAAGYAQKPFDRSRTSVVVGTIFGGDFNVHLNLALRLPECERDLRAALRQQGVLDAEIGQIVEQFREVFLRRKPMLHDETGSYSSSTLASRVAKTLDLQGGALAVDGGEASSFAALDVAADLLGSGACDLVFCAGAQRAMDIWYYENLAMRGLIGDGQSPGLVPGEGVGVLLLKRLSDARRDGDSIQCVIRGIRSGRTAVAAVDSVGERGVEALIGHTLGASGMVSLMKLILALQHGHVPAGNSMTSSRHGVVSATAFRGLAYHVVAETDPGVVESPEAPEDWRIVRLGAPTVAHLKELLGGSVDRAESLYAGAERSRYDAQDHVRMAIVAPNAGTLGKKLRLAATQLLAQPGAGPVLEEQGIFWRDQARTPHRLALLFPGQGSQYVGMLRELVRESVAARAMLDQVNETMQRLGFQTFSQIAWTEETPLGEDVWLTQVSVLLADLIVYAALGALGIRPDVIAGHSYGEYPALVASGAWTLEEAIRLTRARCGFIEASARTSGVMLSTTAPLEVVQRLTTGIRGTVGVANHNAPDQTVIGGEREAVAQIEGRLVAEGFEAQILPVPRAFHTPLMAEVEEPLRRALREARIVPPAIPLLSSVTNRYVADPMDIRDGLVRQLTEPVRYVDLIERLAIDGTTVFVEVGPRQVLTRLNRRILTDGDSITVAADNPRRPGLSQLLYVQAALECAGVIGSERPMRDLFASRPAALVPVVFFDATRFRRERMRGLADPPAPAAVEPMSAPVGPAAAEDALTAFLKDFVCEQTGYPREVVDLDADMEADLGIDSIKKAQLFGELRERFSLQFPSGDRLALDDFPTLRHVLEFLRKAGVTPGGLDHDRLEVRAAGPTAADGRPAQDDGETGVPLAALNLIRCRGTPDEMGAQQALARAPEIRHTLRELKKLLKRQQREEAGRSIILEALVRQADRQFDPDALEELRGMSKTLDVPLSHLIAFNVAVYHEYTAGCAQFAITAGRNGPPGMIHGANEDCPMTLVMPGALTRIVQLRHPTGGIPHVLFGVAGLVGGLSGMNERGLAVTSTMLLDRPYRREGQLGTIHPVLVKTILQNAADVESAIDIIRGTTRIGAWSLCISHHPTDRLAFVEYDADSLEVRLDQDAVMGTNHSLVHLPQDPVPKHSLNRLRRLKSLLGNGRAGFTLTQAQVALQDRYDLDRQRETPHPTMNTIQRVDNLISLVMRPAQGEAWVAPGSQTRAAASEYHRLDVRRLFAAEATSAIAGPPAAVAEGVMSRFILRMVDAPLPPGAGQQPRFNGPVVILGENPTAKALADRLTAMGATVSSLPAEGVVEESLAALDRLWSVQPILHLFLLTARDEDASFGMEGDAWTTRRRRGVTLPYFVCQRWTSLVVEARLVEKSSLVAVTSLGGDFGFSGNVSAAEGGGLAGLLKAIRREFSLPVKVIDSLPQESPESVVAAVFEELAAGAPDVEVGYVRGRRRVVRAVPRAAIRRKRREIPRGDTWVVTGGARGVTAVVARELGRRFGLNLHLIGTRPAPAPDGPWRGEVDLQAAKATVTGGARRAGRDPAAAWEEARKEIEIGRTLQTLARDGVRATYHACDVSDRGALGAVLARIRESAGPIRGIVHGAGVESAARFERKRRDRVEATIAAKVDGAAALIALTQEDPLAYFIGLGSISGRFGGIGQTDYSLASELLAKLVQRLRAARPECAAVTFHWPAWDEVGLAMRPESRVVLEISQQRFMPLLEGVGHLIDELEAGAPEGEVLILDQPGLLDFDGIMPAAAQTQAYHHRQAVIADKPLIEGAFDLREALHLVAEIRLDPVADPFLQQHRFQERPLLPAVIGIEALAEAASVLDPDRTIAGLHHVEIVNGLRFHDDRPRHVEVRVTRGGAGVDCVLCAPFYNRDGRLVDPQRVHVKGLIEFAGPPLEQRMPRAPDHVDAWHDFVYPDGGRVLDEGLVFHGPALRCLKRIALDTAGGWGQIVAPASTELDGDRSGQWIVPAACLDACLVACGAFARQVVGVRQLPHRFEWLRLGRLPRPAETCTLRFDYRGRQDQHTSFDFALFGEDGDLIVSAEDHGCVVLVRQ